ncbi:MAG: hypothetical protein ACI9B2_000929, partial [Flavobacteriales bacterium]
YNLGYGFCRINILNIRKKKGQVIFKNNLTNKAPLVGLELSILMLEYNWKIDN